MSSSLQNKHIVLGICGGIAAYKSAELVRGLKQAGAHVRVVMTQAAQAFITPMTLQALSGHRVHHDLLDVEAEAAMGHIELARWADLVLIAPATAQLMAKLAHGLADDLLTTLCLATTAPIAIAPAMNSHMWQHPATQDNLQRLLSRGIQQIGPDHGVQACGDIGWGRLLEPTAIVESLSIPSADNSWQGKKVVITAGPTREAIDPVRYLSNYSSGKMGYALAAAAKHAGADVVLISGPVEISHPAEVKLVPVISARDMQQAVHQYIDDADIFIAAAAVADYRCQQMANHKIKKSSSSITLELVRNPDIVAEVAALANKPYTVGFAAETERLIEHAQAKLQNKQLDMIIANQVGVPGQGFHSEDNQVTVLTANAEKNFPLQSKSQLAIALIQYMITTLNNHKDRT